MCARDKTTTTTTPLADAEWPIREIVHLTFIHWMAHRYTGKWCVYSINMRWPGKKTTTTTAETGREGHHQENQSDINRVVSHLHALLLYARELKSHWPASLEHSFRLSHLIGWVTVGLWIRFQKSMRIKILGVDSPQVLCIHNSIKRFSTCSISWILPLSLG